MKLSKRNYYSTASNKNFMSVSQFKDFLKCEAMAMAILNGEYQKPKSDALLLGSFVDEMLTGTKRSQVKFIADNYSDLFQKSSKIYVAMNKIDDTKSKNAFVGDYFKNIFEAENKPYAAIVQALETVDRIKKQPLMMEHLSGKQQTIMTGEIAGVPFKIKMDSYHPGKIIVDLKYMASLRSPNLFEPMAKYWGARYTALLENLDETRLVYPE